MNHKLLVTLSPFSQKIKFKNVEVKYNDISKKYDQYTLRKILFEFNPNMIIAGTEHYTKTELNLCPDLKIISRAGIGIDSIDLNECKNRNIIITNTPSASSHSVAELAISQMLNLLKKIPTVNKTWNRYIGREIRDCNIGIIGVGRIGSLVVQKLNSLRPKKIYINDIDKSKEKALKISYDCIPISKKELLKKSDIITIHIPLKDKNIDNTNFITKEDFDIMKKDVCLINAARGAIINENDLSSWLKNCPNCSAAIDVFIEEPYNGILLHYNNVYLTPHIGSCTIKSREKMEFGAIQEIKNYIENKPFSNQII